MKSFLASRQAIHRISLLSSKTQTLSRNFSAITSSISHSDRHLRSYEDQNPLKNAEIPRPISDFNRYFHFTRESRLSESSAAIDDSNDQEVDEDEDGTTNEFLSRFVWIMRGKVSEAYPDCDKKMVDGMLLLIVEKVVEEIERGGFNKVGSAPPSPSSEFSDDLWATIWEVSNTVLKDMEKERKKEKMKQYVQSPEVMEMCRFAGEIGIRGDLLRELRFKWAREKMEDAEFYESLEQQRDLDNSIRESETVDGVEEEEEGSFASDEVEPRSISLPKRKGKFKYKIYGLELSDPKWGKVADKIHEAEEEADWKEPKPVTGKCKLVMEKLESLQEGDDPSGLLSEWVELLEPNRVDWIALLNQLREGNTNAYLKVAELVLDEKSFKASISDYSKLIHIHAKENHNEDVERILKKMSQNGIFPDILTATALVHMYSKSGNLERATEAFENLKSYGLRPDEKIYTSMIMGYVNAGKPKLGDRLMKDMVAKDMKPSEEVYMALLRAFAEMGDANGAATISSSMHADLDSLPLEAWSLLVEAYGKAGQADKAKNKFDEMRRHGHKPDDKCIANVVQAYKGENSLDKALRLLLQLEKDGIEIGVITYTVLVDWMANLGLIEEAEQLLVKISQLGEAPPFELQVSLCYMYATVRNEKKTLQALGVLEAKKDQMGPNEFEKVITALKKGGFEKDARRMYKHMEARKFLPSESLKMDMLGTPRAFGSGYGRMRR
ncbi:PREDICTED: protein NUCLEAR FUSION DEFECTIVE 5, mitochondrial-like [Camelina sativa]|uniref:Protein NUCLEAR FUSION DEFECTIVE 5, mitochondrial-like n=1 Tax=Camelina sativa TaxID=90675 RepID=A0ABM0WWI2_CAMSA|nr:PREDICTED: protein NUCLEAR FUSION DEFECTIVE 5, mitochondrial-like [Camelina sativa]